MDESLELSQSTRNELINQYEKLRSFATEQSDEPAPGLSILFFRGMASWIKTYLCSRQSQASDHFETNNDLDHCSSGFLQSLRQEAVMIMTNMISVYQNK